jgi:hypothetical protein
MDGLELSVGDGSLKQRRHVIALKKSTEIVNQVQHLAGRRGHVNGAQSRSEALPDRARLWA